MKTRAQDREGESTTQADELKTRCGKIRKGKTWINGPISGRNGDDRQADHQGGGRRSA